MHSYLKPSYDKNKVSSSTIWCVSYGFNVTNTAGVYKSRISVYYSAVCMCPCSIVPLSENTCWRNCLETLSASGSPTHKPLAASWHIDMEIDTITFNVTPLQLIWACKCQTYHFIWAITNFRIRLFLYRTWMVGFHKNYANNNIT